MYFADFETTTSAVSKEKSWVWIWGIKGALKGDKMEWGMSMKSFLEHLVKKKISTIYFHNLSFDGNYVFKYLLSNGVKFVNTLDEMDYELKENEFKWICDDGGNIYRMDINYNGWEFKLLCSWKVLMSSVADLGNTIGKDKLELDYDTYYTKKEDVPKHALEYLERDIDVVKETFTQLTEIYEKAMTRAGMSMEDFMEMYGKLEFAYDFGGNVWSYKERKMKYINVLTRDEWITVFSSYQGGYTNWNKKFTDVKIENIKGISYDVNSLYPSVMLQNKYPYGKPLYTEPKDSTFVKLLTVHIVSAVIKDDSYPPIIKDKTKMIDGKYLKELYNEERTYWEEELEFIEKYYDVKYHVIEEMYFKTKWVFKEWLEEKQWLKINAPNDTIKNFHKGILNSLYGKFGQNMNVGSRIIIPYNVPKDKRPKNKISYGANEEFTHKTVYKENKKRKYIPVASFTTMKARMVLFKAMFDNLDVWIYSDTDSCYFSDEPKNIDVHGSALGKWKPEHKYDTIKVLRSKCYMYHSIAEYKNNKWNKEDKLVKKISGVSKDGKKLIDWDNFYLGSVVKGAKKGSRNVKGGKLIITTDYRFGTAINHNDRINTYKKMKEFVKGAK